MRKILFGAILVLAFVCHASGQFLAAKCGDACSEPSDCAKAGNCNLCLSGTCQHRCIEAAEVHGDEEFVTVESI